MHLGALYAGPKVYNDVLRSCDFFQPLYTLLDIWHYTLNEMGIKVVDGQGYLNGVLTLPPNKLPYKGAVGNCWSNCEYKQVTQTVTCADIEDTSKPPCFPSGKLNCIPPSTDPNKDRMQCGWGQWYTP